MTSEIVWHRHHLVPKHAGGGDDKENLIKVNVAMHAFLHEQLYKKFGRWQDKLAADGLKGLISKAEISRLINQQNGKRSGDIAAQNGQLEEARSYINKEKHSKAVSESNSRRAKLGYNRVTCPCGKSFGNKGNLTQHRRKCSE